MKKKTVLVTGSAGLIGSEAVIFFGKKGFDVTGIDNDMRSFFFGKIASTKWNIKRIMEEVPGYRHINCDIRNGKRIGDVFKKNHFDLIIHTAGQPSHDWAAQDPMTDFSINASGTMVLLESMRRYSPEAVFIFTSTNKVYGDRPNALPLAELKMRYDLPKSHQLYKGIDENMSIDQTKHSFLGVSKTAADVMVQEYSRYFGLRTISFRCGCLTGPQHSGAKLHGFLAYLARCIITGEKYTIYGYKGKQVRDNIHAYDLISAFYECYKKPRNGEVYNMGGSRFSNISILEAIDKLEKITGKKAKVGYEKTARQGDHIWYISDVAKFKTHYPKWHHTINIDRILEDICRHGHFS